MKTKGFPREPPLGNGAHMRGGMGDVEGCCRKVMGKDSAGLRRGGQARSTSPLQKSLLLY